MQFTASFQVPRIDGTQFAKLLREALVDHLTEAAVAWLGAVTPKIPVWSGASIATFLPLARAVSYPLEIQPSLFARGSRVSLGLENADGSFDVQEELGKFTFTYSTTLAHLIWNEFNNANINPDPTKWPPPAVLHQPGPYGFEELGEQAFKKYAEGVALPNPFTAVTVREIRVG